MSCNGCRVLRKGCSDTCILRSCLQWIESPEAQGHATVFVAKFFGRAGMMSFINAVAESERPALFQSLLYEACGRTVNPVFGAVGLLWSGNWGVCQAAVETVLKGGVLKPVASSPSSCKLTQPLTLQKSQMNSFSKRPQSIIAETTVNSNADFKRFRSSNQHATEHPEARSKADVAHVNQGMPVTLPNFEVNTSNNPARLATSEALIKEQRPFSCGQLVAPVARRVKPQAGYGLAAMVRREHQQASVNQQRPTNEAVELDLSLNSHVQMIERHTERRDDPAKLGADTHCELQSNVDHASFQKSLSSEEQNALCVEAVRASSPCSLSMNSEGSVISSDTAEFSASCVRAYASYASRHEECQLLHLL